MDRETRTMLGVAVSGIAVLAGVVAFASCDPPPEKRAPLRGDGQVWYEMGKAFEDWQLSCAGHKLKIGQRCVVCRETLSGNIECRGFWLASVQGDE